VPQSPMNLSPSRSSLVTTGLSRNSAGLEQVPFQSNSGHNQASAFQFNSSYTSAVQSQNEGTAQLVQWSSAPQQQNPSVHVPDAAVVLMLAPLSAYNYFYRNERDMIVNGMTSATDPLPPSDFDFTPRKMAELLHQHWYVDPLKKRRRHRKAHGFIAFATLSKEIARRWKTLPKHGRDFYREVAKADQQRHDGYLAALRRQGYDGSLLAMPV
jgi:hypothetical protein